jgi:phage terminase large subunit-like protein
MAPTSQGSKPPANLARFNAHRHGNLYPTKPRPERKIDAAVALLMALGRAMAGAEDAADLAAFLANPVVL